MRCCAGSAYVVTATTQETCPITDHAGYTVPTRLNMSCAGPTRQQELLVDRQQELLVDQRRPGIDLDHTRSGINLR